METTTKQISVTKLTASDGMVITNAADIDIRERLFARVVVLAVNDSADNYCEITEAEAETLRAEQQAAFDADEAAMRAEMEAENGAAPTDIEDAEVEEV